MEERQVTIGEKTFPLGNPFMVLATQNPIEQEGTYPLPEAQKDRFLLKINVTYPDREEEREILKRMGHTSQEIRIDPVIGPEEILRMRSGVDALHADEIVRRILEGIAVP